MLEPVQDRYELLSIVGGQSTAQPQIAISGIQN